MESRIVPTAIVGVMIAIVAAIYVGWPSHTTIQVSDVPTLEIDAQGNLLYGKKVASMSDDVIQGYVDEITSDRGAFTVRGWAADLRAAEPASVVVVFVNGQVSMQGHTGTPRMDVARSLKKAGLSNVGYVMSVPLPASGAIEKPKVRVFAMNRAGQINELRYGAGLTFPQR